MTRAFLSALLLSAFASFASAAEAAPRRFIIGAPFASLERDKAFPQAVLHLTCADGSAGDALQAEECRLFGEAKLTVPLDQAAISKLVDEAKKENARRGGEFQQDADSAPLVTSALHDSAGGAWELGLYRVFKGLYGADEEKARAARISLPPDLVYVMRPTSSGYELEVGARDAKVARVVTDRAEIDKARAAARSADAAARQKKSDSIMDRVKRLVGG